MHKGSCLCGEVTFEVAGESGAADRLPLHEMPEAYRAFRGGDGCAAQRADRRGRRRGRLVLLLRKVRRGFCGDLRYRRCSSTRCSATGSGIYMGAYDTPTHVKLASCVSSSPTRATVTEIARRAAAEPAIAHPATGWRELRCVCRRDRRDRRDHRPAAARPSRAEWPAASAAASSAGQVADFDRRMRLLRGAELRLDAQMQLEAARLRTRPRRAWRDLRASGPRRGQAGPNRRRAPGRPRRPAWRAAHRSRARMVNWAVVVISAASFLQIST